MTIVNYPCCCRAKPPFQGGFTNLASSGGLRPINWWDPLCHLHEISAPWLPRLRLDPKSPRRPRRPTPLVRGSPMHPRTPIPISCPDGSSMGAFAPLLAEGAQGLLSRSGPSLSPAPSWPHMGGRRRFFFHFSSCLCLKNYVQIHLRVEPLPNDLVGVQLHPLPCLTTWTCDCLPIFFFFSIRVALSHIPRQPNQGNNIRKMTYRAPTNLLVPYKEFSLNNILITP